MLTFIIQYDLDLHAGLQLCVLLLGHDQVLQILTLGPAQFLCVVHIQQAPHLARGLGDAYGRVAGWCVSRRVLVWHLESVRNPEAVKLLTVVHAHLSNLHGVGTPEMRRLII